jgi:hypothetical protein
MKSRVLRLTPVWLVNASPLIGLARPHPPAIAKHRR